VRLTPHFDAAEFVCRDGTPTPDDYLHELRHLCRRYLEPLRAEFGPVTIVSGHRSTRHNHQVGGAPASRHLDLPGRAGAAADVVCRRGRPTEWYRLLDGLQAPGLGLYATHVHVDNRRGRARW
jgi:uncharacterized protein YcbK (DUF882 family)